MLRAHKPEVSGKQQPAEDKRKSKSFVLWLTAFGCALAGLLLWLWLWQLVWGATQWLGMALALTATICYLLASFLTIPLLKTTLVTAGNLCTALAIATSLSLGAFLPFRLADFVSPALGRFGGAGALAILAILHLIRGLYLRKSWLLDIAFFCGIGAAWVTVNTIAQASFPPAPTSADQWAFLLGLLFWLGLGCGLVAFALSFVSGWHWLARCLWRWSLAGSLGGLALSLYFQQNEVVLRSGILLAVSVLALLLIFFMKRPRTSGGKAGWLKQPGAVLLILVGLAILYISVGEQLETFFARNTLERYAQKSWWWILGDARFQQQPGGQNSPQSVGVISGLVSDEEGKPLEGANVVVADPTGFTWRATSGPDGRYSVAGVTAGHYLPMAARTGYMDAVSTGDGPLGRWREVASVRQGQNTHNIDFVMKQRQPYRVVPGKSLTLSQYTDTFRDNPVPSPALRRTFSFENDGLQKAGLVYEPIPYRGPGPFPILFIVYPGPANAWEGVSIPLAAQGFVVIAYQPELFGPHPERGMNLKGDVSDLLQLYNYAKAGQFSQRGDPQRVVITGGSVSTAYTYLLLREIETSSASDKAALKGAIAYGGLADLYRYHYDWERGALYIDPGIQDLENLLVAFGRPDTAPELYMLFSPLYHLQPGALPPLLLVHTSKDSIVPVNQTELLVAEMERLKMPQKAIIYPNIEHYLDTSKPDPAQRDMLEKTIEFVKEVTK
ncbi:MAG TPA: carboxypeptidase regulatory-like domain-containing protein [Chloroflexia bacterium]|nr:carboxypeptidase regulatory-like domain-containing protein [Chloroflexia bacterium]